MEEKEVTEVGVETKVKPRKQKIKAGRVVRLTPDLVKLIEGNRSEKETVSAVLRRLVADAQKAGRSYFVLPSDLYASLSRARGAAVVRAVRTMKIEKPVVVREFKGE